jgi:carboxyl-terminal processing protease
MARSSRTVILMVLFLTVCGYLGLLFAQRTPAAAPTSSGESDVRDSLNQFAEVYKVVEENYAEPVNPDKAYLQRRHPGHAACARPSLQFL